MTAGSQTGPESFHAAGRVHSGRWDRARPGTGRPSHCSTRPASRSNGRSSRPGGEAQSNGLAADLSTELIGAVRETGVALKTKLLPRRRAASSFGPAGQRERPVPQGARPVRRRPPDPQPAGPAEPVQRRQLPPRPRDHRGPVRHQRARDRARAWCRASRSSPRPRACGSSGSRSSWPCDRAASRSTASTRRTS